MTLVVARWPIVGYASTSPPAEDLGEDLRKQALEYIRRYRSGARLLGYCRFYRRAVTYYEGYCRAFSRLPDPPPGVRPLTEYMG